MDAIGIIPARLASTRLPRKLLLDQTGKPLLQHTWEAACAAQRLSRVIIATDSSEIAQAASDFGAECQMTGEHPSGTDRIAEAARRCCPEAKLLVNIQGDEPELDPAHIDQLVQLLEVADFAEMSTLATTIRDRAELEDMSCTKVVCGSAGQALYFSRLPIPAVRDQDPDELLATGCSPWKLHIGAYAYRAEFLQEFSAAPVSTLEKLEKLEQLRALEMGAAIVVGQVDHRAPGVDTPADYEQFVERFKAGA